MIMLPLAFRSGKTFLAELDPEHYITDKKRVVAKLTADNSWAKPVESVNAAEYLSFTSEEFDELTAPWRAYKEWAKTAVEKHLAGKHDQSTHGGNRASVESPEFNDREKRAIATYSSRAALQINNKLRGIPTKGQLRSVWDMSDKEIDEAVISLDNAISKSNLKQKMTLEREMPASFIKTGPLQSAEGRIISDKGYLSLRNTQSNIPAQQGFVKLIVTAPAGTPALDLSFINPNAMGEVVFPRGTKLKITRISSSTYDTVVRGEIVD